MPTLAITVIAMALFSTTRFVGILERAVSSGIGKEVFVLFFLNYPGYLLEVLPLGLYLGVILGIGKLYADNEITAILASGTSFKTLLIGVLIPAFIATVLLWMVSLWLAPMSANKGDEMWRTLTSRTSFDLIEIGEFNSLNKNGMTLYVEDRGGRENTLTHIFFGDPSTKQFIWSSTAKLDTGDPDQARYFTFNDGLQLRGSPATQSEITRFSSQSIKIVEPPKQNRADKAHLFSNKELLDKGTRWTKTELLYRVLMPPMAIVLAVLGL
ncbi:MAG: LptF/LptG family permease, partial [Thiomicrorhabdus sp.]|nr:LptF/LptG family permease [Thiomicrorhabdus sp.]